MSQYLINKPSGKLDKRSRITHVFRHAGPGLVEHSASYASGSEACKSLGLSNAHIVGYNRNEVSVIRNNDGKWHLIQVDDGPTALASAQHRALVHEVHQIMNVPTLCGLSRKTLTTILIEHSKAMLKANEQ